MPDAQDISLPQAIFSGKTLTHCFYLFSFASFASFALEYFLFVGSNQP